MLPPLGDEPPVPAPARTRGLHWALSMGEAWSQARNFFARELLPRLETRDAEGMIRGLGEVLAFRCEHLNLVGYKSNGKVEAAVVV